MKSINLMNKIYSHDERSNFILFLFIIVILNICVHFSELKSGLAIYGDMSNFYILARLNDASIFRNDFYGKFIFDTFYYLQYGYYIFSWFLTLLFPMEFIFKVIPISLNIISAWVLFKAGSIIKNAEFGLILGISSGLVSLSMDSFYGYAPRIYGYLIFCIFLYLMLKKRVILASFFSAISLFFYCYVFPYTAISSYLFILLEKNANFLNRIKMLITISLIFALSIILFKQRSDIFLKKYGETFSYSELQNMPEAGKQGSYPYATLHKNYFLSNILNIYEHNEIYRKLILFFAIVIFLSLFINLPGLKIPGSFLIISVSSLITFCLAYFLYTTFGLRFIFASRFIIFSLPILFAFMFSSSIYKISAKFKISSSVLLLVLVTLFIMNCKIYFRNLDEYKDVFNFFKKTAKDSLVAGHPLGTEYIPLFSKRKVLIVTRMARPINKFIWSESKKRLEDLFGAYYSDKIDEASTLCSKYRIDYLVVDERYFGSEYFNTKQLYFEPFGSFIREKAKKSQYALLDFARLNFDFSSNGIYVIGCNKLSK